MTDPGRGMLPAVVTRGLDPETGGLFWALCVRRPVHATPIGTKAYAEYMTRISAAITKSEGGWAHPVTVSDYMQDLRAARTAFADAMAAPDAYYR